MLLGKVIKEKLVDYFAGPHWTKFVETLERAGGDDILHAHIYTDTTVHPQSLSEIICRYYAELRGRRIQRGVRILSAYRKGGADIYNVLPEGLCHHEMIIRWNEEVVLEPMSPRATRQGATVEYWDTAFMERYYSQFQFRPCGPEEERQVRAYFQTDEWYKAVRFMQEGGLHNHALVESSIHPLDVLRIAREEIERRGWVVGRAVSVVYPMYGQDYPKLTFLLNRPELVLEIEWEYNPDVIFQPGREAFILPVTTQKVESEMAGFPWIVLSERDVDDVLAMLRERVAAPAAAGA